MLAIFFLIECYKAIEMLRYFKASLCEDQKESEIYRGIFVILGSFNSFKKLQFEKNISEIDFG